MNELLRITLEVSCITRQYEMYERIATPNARNSILYNRGKRQVSFPMASKVFHQVLVSSKHLEVFSDH